MQERVKTSFIPKASLAVEHRESTSKNPIGIVNIIATIILIAAIIGAVVLFLFEQFTIQSIERKRDSLDRARAAFEPATIKELSRLNTRLEGGSVLLGSHLAPSYLFDEIEKLTLDSVRFRDFSYGEVSPGRIMVAMAGEARSFNALALQSDAFGASDFFTEPIFTDLNLDDTGNVVFTFNGVVDTTQLRFTPRAVTDVAPSTDTSNEVAP
ncbi:MAG: hypothetical protein AAB439_02025 [Patescibacteria group bacterium]